MSIAVIIPVYNSASMLSATLHALRSSTRAPDELWVVDDASEDDSGAVAKALGANVLHLEQNIGPAACRNRGVLCTSSSIVAFFDADTQVHPDTLERLEAHFANEPNLAAVIGAYDDTPQESDPISQYRNLAHCYIHQSSRSDALTFWTGCGAVRRDAFVHVEGFDERYRRPSVEDIEFGYRLTDQGFRIRLDPCIMVKHAKRWTLCTALVTDLWDRGIPWMALLLQRGSVPNDLNIGMRHRVSTAMTGFACLLVALAEESGLWLVASFALIVLAISLHARLFRFVVRGRLALYPVAWALFLLSELCNLVAIPGGALLWLLSLNRSQRCSCIRVNVLPETESEAVSG
ncbi:MAG: glycosyltransferase [Acidobacteriaceae bacterium]